MTLDLPRRVSRWPLIPKPRQRLRCIVSASARAPSAIARIASDPRGALLAELDRPGAGADRRSRSADQRGGRAGRARFPPGPQGRAAGGAHHPRCRAAGCAGRQQAARNAAKAGSDMRSGPDMAARRRHEAGPRDEAGRRARSRPGHSAGDFARGGEGPHSRPPPAPTSALRSGWSGSGRIISASPPARAAACSQLAGAYEREAIRPHVLGRFDDMLLAVETHPAMLLYLDNARSIGPNSPAGQRGGKGLNENLAREILELHTLGVRTVYSQADVTRFADVITGWTIVPPRPELPHAGEFTFNARMHEPAAADGDRQDLSGRRVSSRAARCCRRWRAIRPPPATSPPSWRAISWPTIRRSRWSTSSPSAFSTPRAISRRWPRRWWRRPKAGRRRRASSSVRANG